MYIIKWPFKFRLSRRKPNMTYVSRRCAGSAATEQRVNGKREEIDWFQYTFIYK